MSKSTSVYLANESDTEALGAALAKVRPASATLFLRGDLGAGKTTFCRGFIQACGHQGPVKSPTYTLIEPYSLEAGLKTETILHLDLYRLVDPEELEYLGMNDYPGDVIKLIEWPERGSGHLLSPDLSIELVQADPGRQVTLTAHTGGAESWLQQISPHLRKISKFSV